MHLCVGLNRPLFAGGSIHTYFGASGKQGAVQEANSQGNRNSNSKDKFIHSGNLLAPFQGPPSFSMMAYVSA